MLSNNIHYTLSKNYLDTVEKSKEYLSEVGLKNECSNIQEDDYTAKKSSILSI